TTQRLPLGSTEMRAQLEPLPRLANDAPFHFQGTPSMPITHTAPFAPMPMSMALPGTCCHVVPFHLKMTLFRLTSHGTPFGSTAMRFAPPPGETGPELVRW